MATTVELHLWPAIGRVLGSYCGDWDRASTNGMINGTPSQEERCLNDSTLALVQQVSIIAIDLSS